MHWLLKLGSENLNHRPRNLQLHCQKYDGVIISEKATIYLKVLDYVDTDTCAEICVNFNVCALVGRMQKGEW